MSPLWCLFLLAPPHRAKGKKACVECANIQQPTANIQFAPPSLNNGYWILDNCTLATFPSPPTQSGGGQVDSCNWFHGLLLSCRMWKCGSVANTNVAVTAALAGLAIRASQAERKRVPSSNFNLQFPVSHKQQIDFRIKGAQVADCFYNIT